MKKFLAMALAILSFGFAASSVEAKTPASSSKAITANAGKPQINVRIGGQNRRRNRRVVTTRRISPNGRRVVTRTYRSNGRRTVVRRQVIRRPSRRY